MSTTRSRDPHVPADHLVPGCGTTVLVAIGLLVAGVVALRCCGPRLTTTVRFTVPDHATLFIDGTRLDYLPREYGLDVFESWVGGYYIPSPWPAEGRDSALCEGDWETRDGRLRLAFTRHGDRFWCHYQRGATKGFFLFRVEDLRGRSLQPCDLFLWRYPRGTETIDITFHPVPRTETP